MERERERDKIHFKKGKKDRNNSIKILSVKRKVT